METCTPSHAARWRQVGSLLLALCLHGLSGSVFAAAVTRGPYLMVGTPESIVIRWRTDVATDSRVQYGTTPGSLTQAATDTAATTEHEVRLTGLAAETRYFYSVGSSGGVLAGNDASTFFRTSPPNGTPRPVRIWAIGDAGTGSSVQTAVYNAYLAAAGSTYTNLWLMLGDNAYDSGTDAEYSTRLFAVYGTLLKQSPLWPTIGNHDAISADSATQSGPYYQQFTMPRNAEAGGVASGTKAYYSFNHANIHFIVLDSQATSRATNGAMMNWLKADLQADNSDWVIAYWHHPPYSKGSHDSDSSSNLIEMRENFLPVLEAHGVDLVLSGHSHSYERSYLIDGHYGKSATFGASHKIDGGNGRTDGTGAYAKSAGSTPHEGAVYSVVGSSGQISGGTLNHPAMFISLNEAGSMVLDVNGQTLNAKFLGSNGVERDHFTIVKSAATRSCTLPWGGTLANGRSVTAYKVQVSSNCAMQSETRTCSDGTLSGSYTYANCSAGGAATTVVLQNGSNGYTGAEDTYLSSKLASSNYGTAATLLNDQGDSSGGNQYSLLKWNLGSIPAGATVQSGSLGLTVSNASAGTYNVYQYNKAWSHGSATWSNQSPDANLGPLVATISATSTGTKAIALNDAGLAMLRGWLAGTLANNGVLIKSAGTTDGLDLRASEYGTVAQRPSLTIQYTR